MENIDNICPFMSDADNAVSCNIHCVLYMNHKCAIRLTAEAAETIRKKIILDDSRLRH